ncbi:MAG: hypothetical protein M1828_003847 [Chrysothrix sp. TS-e1954]|nr:MAG: hypothetical protein M1828_003847 [Chrysothrix sp. TS-e1954]
MIEFAPWEIFMRQQTSFIHACNDIGDYSLLQGYDKVISNHPFLPSVSYMIGGLQAVLSDADDDRSDKKLPTDEAQKARAKEVLDLTNKAIEQQKAELEDGKKTGKIKDAAWQAKMVAQSSKLKTEFASKIDEITEKNIEDIKKLPEAQQGPAADRSIQATNWLSQTLISVLGALNTAWQTVTMFLEQAWAKVQQAFTDAYNAVKNATEKVVEFFDNLL